jgi:hypothetical protein
MLLAISHNPKLSREREQDQWAGNMPSIDGNFISIVANSVAHFSMIIPQEMMLDLPSWEVQQQAEAS